MDEFDYVIAGAGAAGCVLANRLSEDPSTRVLLLESGPEDRHPFIHMPKGVGKILESKKHTWTYPVRRAAGDMDPSEFWVRGRTLGGSSSVNGMLYVRGQPADYEALARATSPDWGWQEMERAFLALENHSLPGGESRGHGGPLNITSYNYPGGDRAICQAALAAAASQGIPIQEDVNKPDDGEKIGYAVSTISKGRRQSSATAFLKPIRHRTNLTVRTGVLVQRVIFSGRRAVAVETSMGGKTKRFRGKRIILCAGALSSPAILQRSGVGPAGLLEQLGVPVIADRRDVGANLSEHTAHMMQWRVKDTPTNNAQYRGLGILKNTLLYYLARRGLMSGPVFDAVGFIKTRPELQRPNAQLVIAPHTMENGSLRPEKEPGFLIAAYTLRPRSRGTVEIVSADPSVLPRITFDPLADEADVREQIELLRFVRKLVATPPLSNLIVAETRPGASFETDAQLRDAISQYGAACYHSAGTCRMGNDDDSVVDTLTRVRGVDGLHVVDLSIVPFLVAGNTFGPVAALAWRAAELLRR